MLPPMEERALAERYFKEGGSLAGVMAYFIEELVENCVDDLIEEATDLSIDEVPSDFIPEAVWAVAYDVACAEAEGWGSNYWQCITDQMMDGSAVYDAWEAYRNRQGSEKE